MKKLFVLVLTAIFIIACGSGNVILKSPVKGEKVERGGKINIAWETGKEKSNRIIKVELLKDGKTILQLNEAKESDGKTTIIIPYSVKSGRYKFAVIAIEPEKKNEPVKTISDEFIIENPIITKNKMSLLDFFDKIIEGKIKGNDYINNLFKHKKIVKGKDDFNDYMNNLINSKDQSNMVFKYNNSTSDMIVYKLVMERNYFERKFLRQLGQIFGNDTKNKSEYIAVLKQSGRFYKEANLSENIDLIFLGIRDMTFVDRARRKTVKQVLIFREPDENDEIKQGKKE